MALLPAEKEHRVAVRAGLFVLGSILATVVVFVILGNAHRLFERTTSYVAHFRDVDGLVLDSPVRLGGLIVGTVTSITFSEEAKDTRVQVKLQISNEFTSRVRTDSIARVASRGLLGDKTIDVTLGSDQGTPLPEGGELTAGSGNDIGSVLKASTEVVDNVVAISGDLRKAIAVYASPAVSDELTGSLKALRGILDEVATGPGALHAAIYDPKTGADMTALLASATQVARRLDGAVMHVDAMLEEIRTGQGTAHELLYGKDGKAAIAELGTAAAEVGALIHEVRNSKDSAVHALLVGDSKAVVEDLSAAATSLKNITARVDRGEGTLGALINDPTAYEDLKTILGNVQRNRLLRELVRLTVSNRGGYVDTGKSQAVPAAEVAP